MPSQKQVKWSQLKVGITVVIASLTLGVLIFLMSSTGGWFTKKSNLDLILTTPADCGWARRYA